MHWGTGPPRGSSLVLTRPAGIGGGLGLSWGRMRGGEESRKQLEGVCRKLKFGVEGVTVVWESGWCLLDTTLLDTI